MPGNFTFRSLTPEVRAFIVEEVNLDIADEVLYPSKLFNERGRDTYPGLLQRAVAEFNEVWLASELSGSFVDVDGNGKKVRRDQNTFFAQNEFNRFYIRGVCRFALANPAYGVRIYRGRESSQQRDASQEKIGQAFDPQLVLDDLRNRLGVAPQAGLPEINSGLTLEFFLLDGTGAI